MNEFKAGKTTDILVYVEEIKVHSAVMHLLSQRILDWMSDGFDESQIQYAQSAIEASNKKRMQRNSLSLMSHSAFDDDARVMDTLLDKEWNKLTAQIDEYGRLLSPIKARMSLSREMRKSQSLKSQQQSNRNNSSTQSIYSLPVFDTFYLLASDNLKITHEKYAIHLVYRVSLNKSDMETELMLRGIRYCYCDLDQLLNLARDHPIIKRNQFFQRVMRQELHSRFEMYRDQLIPQQRGRNHYDYTLFYAKHNSADFKANFLKWLFNSEHHPGFKGEITKIQESVREQQQKQEQRRNNNNNNTEHHPNQLRVAKPNLTSNQSSTHTNNSNSDSFNRSNLTTSTTANSCNQTTSQQSQSSFNQNRTITSQQSNRQQQSTMLHSSHSYPAPQTGGVPQSQQPLLNLSQEERKYMSSTIPLRRDGFNSNKLRSPADNDTGCIMF